MSTFRPEACSRKVSINGEPLSIPAVLPKLKSTPGSTEWPGSELGSHNQEVLQGVLGMTADEIATLEAEGVIENGTI